MADILTAVVPGSDDWQPIWSPDGLRVLFGSYRNGPIDMYIKPADGGGHDQEFMRTPIQKGPRDWSRDGRYVVVTIAAAQPFVAGPPRTLFHVEGIRAGTPGSTSYEVTRDGQRFLLNLLKGAPPSPSLSVILNWPAASR